MCGCVICGAFVVCVCLLSSDRAGQGGYPSVGKVDSQEWIGRSRLGRSVGRSFLVRLDRYLDGDALENFKCRRVTRVLDVDTHSPPLVF